MRIAFTHNLLRVHNEEEAKFDTPETVAAIIEGLERLGHKVLPIEVSGSVGHLVGRLEGFEPDLVFNTAEGTSGRTREAFYPALFDQLGLPFTGSDAFACTLTLDKRLSKLMVAEVGVPTPPSVLVVDPQQTLPALRFPVIVKPNYEGSSKGIDRDSIVLTPEALAPRLALALAHFPDGVLVEEFIVGHDVTVPFLAGASPETGGVLPAAEYLIGGKSQGDALAIYDFHLKHEDSGLIEVRAPAVLPEATAAELVGYTRRVHAALGVRDFGRTDYRIDRDGKVWFIEVNALPSLEPGASIHVAAELAGVGDFDAVLDAIVRSAAERFGIMERLEETYKTHKRRVGLIFNLKRTKPTAGGAEDSEAEYDSPETVNAIAEAIASWEHEVVMIEATAPGLAKLGDANLDVAFNMAEGVRGRSRESLVPALLELYGVPYTGSDAATMAVALDKGLAKRVVREAGVATAPFVLMTSVDTPVPPELTWPMIIKPVAEGSSKGVLGPSVVRDLEGLREAVSRCIDRYRQPALVEQFLSGREFTVAVLGNPGETLPPMEIVFNAEAGPDPVYSFDHKLAFHGAVSYQCPARVSEEMEAELRQVALDSYTALGCRDVARIDIRLDHAGRACFIECNPLPGLTPGWSDLCLIADASGLPYRELIGRILEPALERAVCGEL